METPTKQAIEIFKKNYSKWIQNQAHAQSEYDYEKSYVEMMQKVSEEVLQSTVESTHQKNVLLKMSDDQTHLYQIIHQNF